MTLCPAPNIDYAIRALATVTINAFALPIQDIKTKTELDLSGKRLGVEDAIIIAALIPLNVSRTKRYHLLFTDIAIITPPRGR